MTYTLIAPTALDPDPTGITRDADGATIPADPGNADWQAYLAWLAAGNTPNPAPAPSSAVMRAT